MVTKFTLTGKAAISSSLVCHSVPQFPHLLIWTFFTGDTRGEFPDMQAVAWPLIRRTPGLQHFDDAVPSDLSKLL